MCLCREHWISDSRRQSRNYKQWAGGWSILDILLRDANSSIFACDGYVRCRCCSRIRSNVAIAHAFNSLARVVNTHVVTPHCIPQIMLATFKVRKYFWVSLVTRALALTIRVIYVVWIDSHLPSASSDFYAANFVLSISQFHAVQFQFRSPGLGYFLSS